MPWGLKRFQQARSLHFVTFSCHHRDPLLNDAGAREVFERTLERVRQWYGFYVSGYVIMPEHVHLLISEPERGSLSLALQMLKQNTAHQLRPPEGGPFWERRYYDFNVWSEAKLVEKLRYIHRNPVKRGLVARPEDWQWSSFRHYVSGVESAVEIESQWTARKREKMGVVPRMDCQSQNPHPVAKNATRVGHPHPDCAQTGTDGVVPRMVCRSQNPHPVAKDATRVGHPHPE
ncbi:MAG: REP-associated tyrosine transposase [Candidatus Sulfotelmatobacter sp.]